VRDQLERDAVFRVALAERREHVGVEELGEHDGGQRLAGLVAVADGALGDVLAVELKVGADALAGAPGRRVAAREVDGAPGRGDDQMTTVGGRHPRLQPGQEPGHVLAPQRGRVLAAVLAQAQVVRQGPQPLQVAVRGQRLAVRQALDHVALGRVAQPALVDVREVERLLVVDPEDAEIPDVAGAFLLGRRGQPPRRAQRDLERAPRRVGPW
jgi:hypothetical protein